jgi:hypothetical protein
MAKKKPTTKPEYTARNPMTKTVIKKVSPNVKVIKPGSRPLTQSATEKRQIVERAKTKTPAARELQKAQASRAKNEARREANFTRVDIYNRTYRQSMADQLGDNWYNQPEKRINKNSAAHKKALQEADVAIKRYKDRLKERKPLEKAKRDAANRAAGLERSRTSNPRGRGAGGLGGLMPGAGGNLREQTR